MFLAQFFAYEWFTLFLFPSRSVLLRLRCIQSHKVDLYTDLSGYGVKDNSKQDKKKGEKHVVKEAADS